MMRTHVAAWLLVVTSATCVSAQTPAAERLDAVGVFKKAHAAVVTITTPTGLGSGVLVDPSGVIATNLHVVRGDSSATVTLANHDAYDDVEVVAVDARKDLVLLKVKAFKAASIILGDSDDLAVGNAVYAIGTPQGLELTMTEGIVSSLRDSGEGYGVIQTSAAISPGSSGGGLFNDRGELVGITSFRIKGGESLNFAVPVNYLRGMLGTTAKFTLTELAAQYPATAEAPTGDGENVTEETPRLAKVYTNSDKNFLVVKQDGGNLTSTRVFFDGDVYGHSSLVWDGAKKGFIGTGSLKTPCGKLIPRTTTALIVEEIYVLDDRLIRDRRTRPLKVNCSTGVVESYTWEEHLWYVP
jgi:serine protease Do